MDRVFSGFGIPDVLTRTQSPTSPAASSTQEEIVPVNVNNQVIYVDRNLEKDVCDAVDSIRSDYTNAIMLKKELILNTDILIALLNHAKLYWHSWFFKARGKTGASDRIESAFINNKNLSKQESDWVKGTIRTYKNNMECAIAQNSLEYIQLYKPYTNSL